MRVILFGDLEGVNYGLIADLKLRAVGLDWGLAKVTAVKVLRDLLEVVCKPRRGDLENEGDALLELVLSTPRAKSVLSLLR